MNFKGLLGALATASTISLIAAAAAVAQPRVIQTRCDTLSTNPPLVKVTFAVLNLGNVPICSVHFHPIQSGNTPPDSCRVLSCEAPTGWVCAAPLPGGDADFHADQPDPALPPPCIQFGQKFENFTVTLDPLFCCYNVGFDDPNHQIFFVDTVCFECEKPTPTRSGTWGQLKMRYR